MRNRRQGRPSIGGNLPRLSTLYSLEFIAYAQGVHHGVYLNIRGQLIATRELNFGFGIDIDPTYGCID